MGLDAKVNQFFMNLGPPPLPGGAWGFSAFLRKSIELVKFNVFTLVYLII